MRLSGISMFGQQSGLGHVNRADQSAAKRSQAAKSGHMMQIRRDAVTISPQGRTARMIESLNQQKANILERRDQFVESAKKQGQSMDAIKTQLEQFDEQIKDIDKQIAEATLKKMQETAEKSAPKIKHSKPRTKQDVQNDILANITAASTTLDRMEAVSSEKNKLDGNANVLKSEIELDKARDSTGSGQQIIAKKEEHLAQMQSRSQGLMQDIGDGMEAANEILEENHELAATKPVEDDKDTDKVGDKNDKDASKAEAQHTDANRIFEDASVLSQKDRKEAVEQTDEAVKVQD